MDEKGCKVRIIQKTVSIYDTDGKLLRQESIVGLHQRKTFWANTLLWTTLSRSGVPKRKRKPFETCSASAALTWKQVKEQQGMADVDDFDFICHVAFDKKPLTRRERANNVKKRDFLSKYSGAAREVLEALLDKYMNTDIYEIEKTEVLKLDPFVKMGRPAKIASYFGGKRWVFEGRQGTGKRDLYQRGSIKWKN